MTDKARERSIKHFQHMLCTVNNCGWGSSVYAMRVTILSKPVGAVRGMWLVSLQVGQTYNLKDDVARALVLSGYAIEERRFGERRRTRRDEPPGRRHAD